MTDISRRSLGKGVAWSAPVITIAAAAPAVAASSQSTVLMEANIEGYSKSPNVPTVTAKTPAFLDNPPDIFFKSGVDSATLTAYSYQVVIPSPNATFDVVNGGSQDNWIFPDGPSETTTLDGVTAYVYTFAYRGADLPVTLSNQTDFGSGPGVFAQFGGNTWFHMKSGDGVDVGSPFQGRLTAVIDGVSYSRTSVIGHIVSEADGNSANYIIGDNVG